MSSSPFDLTAVIRTARHQPVPGDWQVLPLRRSAVIWDLLCRVGAGVVLLVVCSLLAANAGNSGDGLVPYVFSAFALLAALTYLTAAWTPLQQLRRPDDYLLVLASSGIVLAWSSRTIGLPFAALADVSLRRRSFRAIFSHDLILSESDGREVILPVGELFGEPADLLTAVVERARGAHGQPTTSVN